MKVLVAGGTSGLGLAVTSELCRLGCETVTVGRTAIDSTHAYRCNIGNKQEWLNTLTRLTDDHTHFDLVVNLVGYGRLCDPVSLTQEDWRLTNQKNYGYVRQAYKYLRKTGGISDKSCFVVTGSRWSYRSNPFLLPYSAAKHRLRHWVNQQAVKNQAGPRFLHYAVPTIETPQYYRSRTERDRYV